MLSERAGRPAASAKAWAVVPLEFVRQTLVIVEAEARKLRHDPTEMVTRVVQPVLWLAVFGQVMGRVRAIPTGELEYLDFLAPGVLAQSVLFLSIFFGISAVWERDLGIVQKYLASPAYRVALVAGKAAAAGVRSLFQAAAVYVLAAVMGVHLRTGPLELAGLVVLVFLGAAIFATFSLIVASLVRSRERFMGIGQLLTMPLFFASSAIYPLSVMPRWLQWISAANPLTYQVDALRALMVAGGQSALGLGVDFAVQAAALVLLLWLGARLYPRLGE